MNQINGEVSVYIAPAHNSFAGLDPSGYRTASGVGEEEGVESSLLGPVGGRTSQDQFSDVKQLVVPCPHCGERVEIKGAKVRECVHTL